MSVDKDKIEEIRENYRNKADHEIELAKKENDSFGDSDENKIRNKYAYEEEQSIQKIYRLGPKRLFQLELSDNPNGWRRGYTKSPIRKGVERRRKQNKMARKTRAQQRKKK